MEHVQAIIDFCWNNPEVLAQLLTHELQTTVNLGLGATGLSDEGQPATQSGKRLLNGALWYASTRGSTTAAGACWIKGGLDAVSNCTNGHSGKIFADVSNYDYDTP